MRGNDLNLLINILLLLAIFLSASGFLMDLRNTESFSGVDLRNRVVGSRLLISHKDPYFYKWHEEDSVKLLNPRDNPEWKVSMVTVPPTVLIFHSSFSWLNYKAQRYFWFFFQWLMFLGSLFLFSRSTSSQIKSKIIWICGLFFIGSSFFWRLHVERGQIYILYVFLISLIFWINSRGKTNSEFFSGIVAGLAMSLRPPLVLISLPMLIYKKIKFILGNIIGVAIGIGSTFLFIAPKIWLSYFSAMKTHGIFHLQSQTLTSLHYPYQDIEGVANLWSLANIPILDTSLQFLAKSVGINLTSNLLFIFLIVTLITTCFIIKKLINSSENNNLIILSGIILVFIAEYFLPAARFSYNNVLILPIISIIIIDSERILKL